MLPRPSKKEYTGHMNILKTALGPKDRLEYGSFVLGTGGWGGGGWGGPDTATPTSLSNTLSEAPSLLRLRAAAQET